MNRYLQSRRGNGRLETTYQAFGTRHRKENSTHAATSAALSSSLRRAVYSLGERRDNLENGSVCSLLNHPPPTHDSNRPSNHSGRFYACMQHRYSMCENLGFWNYFKKEKPLITTIPCSCEVGEVSTSAILPIFWYWLDRDRERARK
ncbi:hypothetical protein QL285_096446 [Trifolium repens]|nr:hypothetical protein QL285_096446 [Trifolium repens]